MIKELKYVFYFFVIFFFFFFTLKYYFSDDNKKNSYRSIQFLDKKIDKYTSDLIILKNDTENIIEYSENKFNKDKKKFSFWKLIIDDDE